MVLFGAQAVSAYVQEPRITQDLDLLSTHAEGVAQRFLGSLRIDTTLTNFRTLSDTRFAWICTKTEICEMSLKCS